MTPEAKVKNAVKKLLTVSEVYFFMPSANGYGRAGIPDFIACVNGHFLAIETKAGNNKPTALQDRESQRIVAAGGDSLLITDAPGSVESLNETIKDLKGRL